MNEENTKKLFERFKFFQPKKSIQESLMAFGFECGDGWFDILWNLSLEIEKELQDPKLKEQQEGEYPFEVVQTKEKFGGLRYYTNWGTDAIYDLISKAEHLSYKTCEACGMPGKPNKEGWITTLCKDHHKANKKGKLNL